MGKTIKITENQKNFLLKFFESDKYPGALSIGEKLITNGKCIVAGSNCIWKGGIGNFIKLSEPIDVDVVGCVEYSFDLDYFMTSEWYKEIKEEYLKELRAEYKALCLKLLNKEIELEELKEL